jgi:DNA-binding MarR family transcriptional regulator
MVETMEVHGLTAKELAVWRAFGSMRRRLDSELERRLQQDAGISASDFDVLVALYGSEDTRMRARDLGESIGWEKSRLSHQVTRMESRGLVGRVECADDLRGIWIGLTDQGREAVAEALPHRVTALRELFLDVVDERELEAILKFSERVLAALSPAEGDCDDAA